MCRVGCSSTTFVRLLALVCSEIFFRTGPARRPLPPACPRSLQPYMGPTRPGVRLAVVARAHRHAHSHLHLLHDKIAVHARATVRLAEVGVAARGVELFGVFLTLFAQLVLLGLGRS